MSASEKDERIEGSKLVLVSEQAMLNLIYTLKTCVLILYTRLTLGLSARRFVRWISLYVAIGWTATQITMFTACRPFSGYWAVPPPNRQCATFEHYAILQGWFNISSDTLMLMVPLPLIFKMSVCWRQKVVLVFIFSLGICVIVAALLTKIFNLGDPYSPNYMLWYIREASVAVYVSNLPLVWPLLREWFPWLRDLKTAGVLPTPAAVAAAAQAKREKEQKLNQTSAADTSQTASPDRPGVGTIRRDTFADFGAWLRPVDLELRKPPRAALASSSRERILGDPDSPGRNKAKRISRFKENIIEEIGYDDPTPRTLDLERGDFIWEIRDHYGQPSTPGARD
ncbi:hypothetical protein CkaCkLH20_03881 [Colletotrichum karsti]|uniref:Rhodopsin domain-containing protein n=1 Tax=Colletotrichum karsti TaxID=1095194 RepID=A0A9P6I8W2_9PEZI|nr:uncharacterized protein CkaCkLH20_03881 [Colletotrichum karsti]KAF9878389.1 hypothetical protein CkaCkLH20_03881 [Colletotrichum karsti]